MFEAIYIFFAKMGYLSIPLFGMGFWGWYQVVFLGDFLRTESQRKGFPTPREFALHKSVPQSLQDSLLGKYLILLRNTNKNDLEHSLLEFQRNQIAPLKGSLSHIRIACAVAPLLGLLGTINGIAAVFTVVSGHGSGNFVLFSDGISEALLTTQTGLIIAFPLLLAHAFVKTKVEEICTTMQRYYDKYSLDKI